MVLIIKKITSIVAGKTLTKKGLASGIEKIVPVVGGVTSGSSKCQYFCGRL